MPAFQTLADLFGAIGGVLTGVADIFDAGSVLAAGS